MIPLHTSSTTLVMVAHCGQVIISFSSWAIGEKQWALHLGVGNLSIYTANDSLRGLGLLDLFGVSALQSEFMQLLL